MVLKPYQKYKASGVEWIGEIPEHWNIEKVSSIFEQRNEKVSDTEYEALSVTKNGILKQLESVAKTDHNDNRKKVLTNDFVINSRSDRKGSCGVSKFDGSVSLICTVIKPNTNEMFMDHFHHLFRNKMFSEEFYRWGRGIVDDLWSTRWDEFKRILIPIPPLHEQEEIADFLNRNYETIESLITKKNQQIETLQKYRQALISETVTKGLDPNAKMRESGVEWIGDIPEHWQVKRLGFLGDLQNGISKSSEEFGFGFPFVSYGDVYKHIELPTEVTGLVNSSRSDRHIYSVQEGDVFFTRTSETVEEIGFTSTCLKTIGDATFAGFLIRFRPRTDELMPNYSKYFFRSDIHRKYFVKEMNIVTRASLSQGLLKKLPVLIPTKEEQIKIADYLDVQCTLIEDLIHKQVQSIKDINNYKNSLIYEAVTGKIDVRNFDESQLEVKL